MGPAAGGILGVFEVQLATRALPVMRSFYEQVVGLEPTVVDDARGRVHYGLGTGQLILAEAGADELPPAWPGLPPGAVQAGDRLEAGPAGHGPVHLALHVDVDGWQGVLGRARAAGNELRGPVSWGPRLRSAYVLDPDGNCLELIGDIAELVPDAPPGS